MSAEHRDQRVKSAEPGSFAARQGEAPLKRAASEASLAPIPDERRILAVMGATRRVGRWIVPKLFRVRAFLGDVRVDLRENPIPKDFTFDVRAYGSRVTLIIPPDCDVIFDVFAFMGNAINQAHESLGGDRRRQIRVVGSAYLGEVRVLVRD
jgi:hypothetical protein